MPQTRHRKVGLQMQIQGGKAFPNILYGGNQEQSLKSMSLEPGFEYIIELDPYGQLSSNDFKSMALDKRQCQLDNEIFDNSSHHYPKSLKQV